MDAPLSGGDVSSMATRPAEYGWMAAKGKSGGAFIRWRASCLTGFERFRHQFMRRMKRSVRG
jgi:hypothetical protein